MASFEKTTILLIFSVALSLAIVSSAHALKNPSVVYCTSLGYNYTQEMTSSGIVDVCKLPDGSNADPWLFLEGEEHTEFSYCVKNGYAIKTVSSSSECISISSRTCAVCVLNNGSEVEVTRLMGLSLAEGTCGDGHCVFGENYLNCPQDCPSGSSDGYCDGVKDGICDPDCISQKTPSKDPDCAPSTTTPSPNQPACGNYICESGENYSNCPQDCPKATDFTIVYVIVGIVVGVLVAIIVIWSRRSQ